MIVDNHESVGTGHGLDSFQKLPYNNIKWLAIRDHNKHELYDMRGSLSAGSSGRLMEYWSIADIFQESECIHPTTPVPQCSITPFSLVAYILYIWVTYVIGFRIITFDDVFGESSERWQRI